MSTELLVLIVPILAFVTILLLAWALAAPRANPVEERLRTYGYDLSKYGTGDLSRSFADRVAGPIARWLGRLITGLTPNGITERARLRLKQAGNPVRLGTFVTVRLAIMILLPVLLLLPLLFGPFNWLNIILAVIALWIGAKLPDIWLSFRIDARDDSIRKALPDALDLITVCVEAGYGLEAALAKVSERTGGHIAREFGRTLGEIQLGKPRREALRDLRDRVPVAELQSFVAALLQADQMGVSIADVLRVQSDAMRVRRRQRAEEMIAKAPLKMLFPMALLIFPVLMIVILAPAFMRIFGMLGVMSQ